MNDRTAESGKIPVLNHGDKRCLILRLQPETTFAVRQTLPVMAGYGFLGMAFGLMLQHAGYHAGWAFLSSALIYAGSMQFVLVGILTAGLSLPTIALMTLSINSRHIFYGLPFIQTFRAMGRRYIYMIFSLTDETYALLCSVQIPDPLDRQKVFFRMALFNQVYWVTGATLGAAFGELARFDFTGIDFAMTALFTVLLVEQWMSARLPGRWSILIGLLSGISTRLIFGADRFVLPALILAAALLMLLRPVLSRQPEHKIEGDGV